MTRDTSYAKAMPKKLPPLPKPIIAPALLTEPASCRGLPGEAGVYRIMIYPIRRCYVGSAFDLASRWLEHQVQLRAGEHPNKGLQAAYNATGGRGFAFEVLEIFRRGHRDPETRWLAEERQMELHSLHMDLFNVRHAGSDQFIARRIKKTGTAGQAGFSPDRKPPKNPFRAKRNPDHF